MTLVKVEPRDGCAAVRDPELLLTIPGASRRVGVGVRQLRRAVKSGGLPVYQIGGWPRVRWGDVIRWVLSQRVAPTSHAARRVAEVLARVQRIGR